MSTTYAIKLYSRNEGTLINQKWHKVVNYLLSHGFTYDVEYGGFYTETSDVIFERDLSTLPLLERLNRAIKVVSQAPSSITLSLDIFKDSIEGLAAIILRIHNYQKSDKWIEYELHTIPNLTLMVRDDDTVNEFVKKFVEPVWDATNAEIGFGDIMEYSSLPQPTLDELEEATIVQPTFHMALSKTVVDRYRAESFKQLPSIKTWPLNRGGLFVALPTHELCPQLKAILESADRKKIHTDGEKK